MHCASPPTLHPIPPPTRSLPQQPTMSPAFVPAAGSLLRTRQHRAPATAPARRAATPARIARRARMSGSGSEAEETVPLVAAPAEKSVPLVAAPAAEAEAPPVAEEEDDRTEQQKENDRLRAAEKFVQVDEGKFECPGCGYLYEPEKGEFLNSVAAGTDFVDLPANFCCPVCKTPKNAFMPVRKTIAGFADNQQYGFGTNTMTAGQKSALIYGGLLVFFLLLLSGYALN